MNMHRPVLVVILAAILPVMGVRAQSPAGVVINEVFTGNPDWIEIANVSGSPQSIGGWQVQAVFGYTVYPAFSFPSGATIAAGECIVVLENSGSITSTINPHPAGTQIFTTNFGYGWIGTSTGAVAIIDDQGQARDLVVFGNGGYLTPPGAGTLTFSALFDRFGNDPTLGNDIYRSTALDTDSGADWQQGLNGVESPGQPNAGQSFGPPPVSRMGIADGSGSVALDPNAQTIAVQATISSLELSGGLDVSDTNWDALIGGTVTVTGSTVGPVLPDLAALLCVPVQVQIGDTSGGLLSMSGVIAAESLLEQELIGPNGTWPISQRAISSRSFSNIVATGSLSPGLQAVQNALGAAPLYFVVRFEATGPRLVSVDVGRDLLAAPAPIESKLAHTGMGALEIGVIRASMNSVIFNVFVITPPLPVGQGPIAGIDWGPSQWQQVYLPLPSPPFHVNPQQPGIFHFSAPPGTVPPGIWLDHVAIQLIGGLPVFSAPTRAYF